MSDKHPIGNGVIATVVGGVILAALGLLWPPAKRLLVWIGMILGTGVMLPVWVFVVSLAVITGVVIALRRSLALYNETTDSLKRKPRSPQIGIHAAQTGSHVSSVPEEPDEGIKVSRLEVEALRRIGKEDDAPLYLDTLKRSLGITNIRLQSVLDRLTELDLVEVDEGDEVVFLTAKGREFVLVYRLAR